MKNESLWDIDNEEIEIRLLLEAIYLKYGYDFRNYSKDHIKRRIEYRMIQSKLSSISELQYQVLYNPLFFKKLFQDLSINVSTMFRDPSFYYKIRKEIIPVLKTYPFIKIWHAGCATGEEVYSMAILLKEEGLLERTQIYATDFNQVLLDQGKEGIYPIDVVKEYTSNYQKSGGNHSFSDYYTAGYNCIILDQSLKKKIIFSHHNLVMDGAFGEMNLILCRNVLIYFNEKLKNHVIQLFLNSLCPGGFLGLGSKGNLKFTNYYNKFDVLDEENRIYKKKFE